jgi:hypothetical protein
MGKPSNRVSAAGKAQLEELTVLEKIWAEAMPNFQVPSDGFFLALLRLGGLASAEIAIDRTRRKAFACRKAGAPMDATHARQYCLAVTFNGAEFSMKPPIRGRHDG